MANIIHLSHLQIKYILLTACLHKTSQIPFSLRDISLMEIVDSVRASCSIYILSQFRGNSYTVSIKLPASFGYLVGVGGGVGDRGVQKKRTDFINHCSKLFGLVWLLLPFLLSPSNQFSYSKSPEGSSSSWWKERGLEQ